MGRYFGYAALLLALSVGRLHAQDAAMFRGGPAHTGVYDDTGLPIVHQVKWRFHTNGHVISSPAIVGQSAYIGSTDGNLYAIALSSGTMRWKFETGARVTSSPAVAHGIVYAESYDGYLYAVDAETGTLRWKFATEGERRFAGTHLHGNLPAAERMPDPFDVFLSSPTVWQGMVYFGSGDGNIYALDAASGEVKWRYHTNDVVHASPAIADGILYIGSWDSYFYALDATSGVLKWKFKTGEDPEIHNQVGIQSSAAVVDGTVYFGCRDAQLYALDAATGQKKWQFDNKGSWVIGSPAVRDGIVYFGTSDSKRIWALSARDGTALFSLPVRWGTFASPAVAGNWLYIGVWDGTMVAVDLKAGKQAWVFETDASHAKLAAHTHPDGSIGFRAEHPERFYDATMAAFEENLSLGAILSSPVVVDHVIYVGSTDGTLYAIR